MAGQELVRPSRDGDQFHYHWAARQCLRLLSETTNLVAVTIEGPSTAEAANDAISEGEELIDVGFYYGAEGRDRARFVHYVQLKHSTRRAREAWTASGLQNTLKGFAQRYTKLLDRFTINDVAQRFRFEFAGNRPIDSNVQEALADLASGAVARHPETQQLLTRYSGLTGAHIQQFFSLFIATGGEGDLWEQRHRLAQDFNQYLAGADSETPLELKELVTRKATTEFESDPSIRRHDVLRALKADPKDLAPAPCLLPDPKDSVPREQEQEILRVLLDATAPVIIHADGGVGKSVLAARLAASMPTNSEAVLYDCFGDGLYRSALGFRHRYRDALVQMANELAAKGLCYPLVPTDRADARQYMRAFLARLTQAVDSLRAKDPNAKLCVIVDAADNAEMAAAEWREPGSFVRDLIRAPLPEGVRIAFTCRSHRRSLLHPPPEALDVALRPFSQAESAKHLRAHYPDASDAEVSEFAFLSSSNPRVQAFVLSGSTSLEAVLRQLGPEPTTVEHAIENLLDTAIARLKDSSSGVEAQHVEMICRGLAVFHPLVPVPVLAKVSGTSEGAVRSFALDLKRPLLLKGDSVHFLDEPTETWFRERFGPEATDLATFIDRLRPLAVENAYAAAALPPLLLQNGKFEELVELALSDASLPSKSPLEQRDVRLQRMRFALKACIQRSDYVSAAKIALKAGGECAGEQRQNQIIKGHTDVASVLMTPDRIEALVARRTFGDSWRGSHYAYEAALMSGSAEHSAEASSRLRIAKDWLSAWARQPKDQRQHHEHVSDEDITELALAMLRLEGAIAAARFLKGWRPRSVSLRAGRHVGRRLLDLSEHEQLDTLAAAAAAERDPWLLLGLCVEANAAGRQLPAPALAGLMRFLQRPGVKLPDPGWDESWRVLDAVHSAIELALTALPHEPEAWAEVLRRYLPEVPPESISIRYGTDRVRLWRAYALEAALRGQRLGLEALTPAQFRERQGRAGGTYEEQLFLAEARGLLPWFSLSAEVACGRPPPDISIAIQNALKETVDAERIVYQEQEPVRQQVAFEWFRVLRLTPALASEQQDALGSWLFKHEPTLPVATVIALCRLAARRDGFERLAIRLGADAYSTLDMSRDDAHARADSLLQLARAILTISREEARAYFNRAIEIASRIGDENLDRWVALLDLATVAAERDRPRPRTAYHLSRAAELTYEYVEQDKHFPWDSTAEALVDLCAASSFAILSRWRDRRFGNRDRLLPVIVERLVEKKLLPEHTPIALAGITAWWDRAKDLKRALSTESDPERRAVLANIAYRYIRVTPSKAETWTTIKELRERYGLELRDFERLLRAASVSREGKAAFPESRPVAVERRHPDWNNFFADTDVSDSVELRSRFTEARKYGPPYDKEAFFREALARVRPGRESEFVRAVAAWPDFDFFDLRDLLRALPSPLPNQLALRNEVRATILSVCRREPQRSQRRGWFETSPLEVLRAGGLVSYNEIAVAALEGVAAQVDRLDASELFQSIGPLSLILSASQAEEVLNFAFDLLDEILKPEDGDGEWREDLSPHGTLVDALAGYIWAGLGSAAAAERWQQAHVIRATAELEWGELLKAIIAMVDADSRAFADQRFAFYAWHARQWLLIGLARGAIENPKGVRPAHVFLQQSLGTKHVVIRELAAQALRTLRDTGEVAAAVGNLTVNQPKDVQVESGDQREDDSAPANEPKSDDRYVFELDIGPYWFAPLGRVFGLSRQAIERRALTVIRKELGWTTGLGWSWDARLSRKIFEEGESSHSHGNLPKADGILTYHAYHAMMAVAAILLSERSVLHRKGERSNEFIDWISGYMLTRTDGRWITDRRAPRLIPEMDTHQEHWRWSISAKYLDQQLTTDDALLVLWGEWQNGESERYETVSIRSALVSTAGAPSLLAALQTAPKFDHFALPYASDRSSRPKIDRDDLEEQDGANQDHDTNTGHESNAEHGSQEFQAKKPSDEDEREVKEDNHEDNEDDDGVLDDMDEVHVNAGPLKLSGWLSHERLEARLDEYDPWGEGVAFPGPAPSGQVVSRLALRSRDDGTVWDTPFGGVLRAELWAQVRRTGRRDETISGERLSANEQLLRELLAAYPDRTLIVSVEVRRHPSRHEHDGGAFENYPQPCIRYYLMGANGVATPL